MYPHFGHIHSEMGKENKLAFRNYIIYFNIYNKPPAGVALRGEPNCAQVMKGSFFARHQWSYVEIYVDLQKRTHFFHNYKNNLKSLDLNQTVGFNGDNQHGMQTVGMTKNSITKGQKSRN